MNEATWAGCSPGNDLGGRSGFCRKAGDGSDPRKESTTLAHFARDFTCFASAVRLTAPVCERA